MKDYYYILGVARTSSPEEIRKAYLKLSLKFHPDKNDGDKFFEDRFKEINEAYEILYNPSRRFNYDEAFVNKGYNQQTNFWAKQTPPRSNPPRIISFTTDKPHMGTGDTTSLKIPVIAIGDTITFNWEVQNATSVELSPFGMVPTTGVKVIKVIGFNLETGLEVELKAYNSATNETDNRKIFFSKRIVGTPKTNSKESNNGQKKKINKQSTIFIAILGVVISILWLNDQSNPTIPKRNTPETTVSGDSEAVIATDSSLTTDSDFTTSNSINSPEPISQWKGNHLKNGDSPFKTCFGKGKRGGRSWILFQNRNGVDAIVCLTNSLSGVTIRNEYVQAGASFEMSNVPDGTYYIKVLYGNDWNPNLTSPCGSKGFFESDVSFSVSDGYSDAINVETSNDGYSIHYSTHTITLYPVANGNMSQRGIDVNQFFGH